MKYLKFFENMNENKNFFKVGDLVKICRMPSNIKNANFNDVYVIGYAGKSKYGGPYTIYTLSGEVVNQVLPMHIRLITDKEKDTEEVKNYLIRLDTKKYNL